MVRSEQQCLLPGMRLKQIVRELPTVESDRRETPSSCEVSNSLDWRCGWLLNIFDFLYL